MGKVKMKNGVRTFTFYCVPIPNGKGKEETMGEQWIIPEKVSIPNGKGKAKNFLIQIYYTYRI